MSLQLKLERAGVAQGIKNVLFVKKVQHLAWIESELNVVAGHMKDNAEAFTPVDKGRLRAGWRGPIKRGRFVWRIENPVDYAVKVNYGQYTYEGPGTAAGGGFMLPGGIDVPSGIYSRKKPEAMVQQALAKAYLELPEAMKRAARGVK